MKTEELLYYQEMYKALRARFGVRFVEFSFRACEKPLSQSGSAGGEQPYPVDVKRRQNGSKSAE